jgi:hypothetical protein
MKHSLYDRGRTEKEGDAMKIIGNAIWLLLAFMLGVSVGLYWGGSTVKQQLREAQAMKDQFLVEQFSK